MREYRGLTKDGNWVYGDVVKNCSIIPTSGGYGSYIETKHPGAPNERTLIGPVIDVIPETVGQATGLCDKNGKDYYFDDIAKWSDRLWVIVWSITLSSIELQPLANYRERQKNPKAKRLYGTCFGIGQAHCSEKVGNVHEAPRNK